MKHTLTIAQRELSSMFRSPIGFVVLGLFAVACGIEFMFDFDPGEPAYLRGAFETTVWVLIFLVPAISMRLISEEARSGSLELLMTSPVSDAAVVLGKWIAAFAFFTTLLAPFVVLWIVMECFADPEWGPFLSGLLGLLFVGGLYLSIGMFASALTRDQIIAFLLTVFIICCFTLLLYFLPNIPQMPLWAKSAVREMNVNYRFQEFSRGTIDLTNVVYFVSGTIMFLFFAVLTVQSRRWR